jgi:hypothetical protein
VTSTHRDDSDMSRFERNGQLRGSSAQVIAAIGVIAVILLLLGGGALTTAGEREEPGAQREILLALGEPAGNVAAATPLAQKVDDLTSGLSPDRELNGGGFSSAERAGTSEQGVPPVTADAISPAAIGEKIDKQELGSVLVTGDSLSTPLDTEIARSFAGTGVDVTTDPYLATGISREDLVDWGEIATAQVDDIHPDAVVIFIGANEGYPMTGADGKPVNCCGSDWVAEYANRARQMMATYRQGGDSHVYWVSVPKARDEARDQIANAVNVGVEAAAAPYRAQVDLLPTDPTFSPDGEYTDAIEVDGREQIVRESDGIHLNELGSQILSEQVLGELGLDYTW